MISTLQVLCALLLAVVTSAQNSNCADPPEAAAIDAKSFDILKTGSNVENTVQCTWTITAPEGQAITVYLTVNTNGGDKQCVKVEETMPPNARDICGVQERNTFTSSSSSVKVSYPPMGGASETVANFKVMYKIAINENCADAPPEATGEEQSFGILKTGDSIPADTKCMWTIRAPASQKIMVYLTVGTGTDKQCIRVQDTTPTTVKDICGKEGENNFTSTGQSVTVSYPKSGGVMESVPNFRVMYRIPNNENCADQPPQATDQEQSFSVLKSGDTIGTDVKCSWNIMAPDSKNITVYLTVGSTSTEKQCVHVMDTGATTGKDICGVQDMNTFTSTSQSVKVSYPKKTGSPEQVSNFKVMYMIAGARRFAPWITAMSSVFILSQILLP